MLGRAPLPLQHWCAASLCLGLVGANALRIGLPGTGLLAAAGVCALLLSTGPRLRLAALCGLVSLAGLAFGSLRLDAIEHSDLVRYAGESASARVIVTGPARASSYGVRAPAQALRFDDETLGERISLELPPGRVPPSGAILELVARVELPKGESADGFNERAWLARQGVHVVLHGSRWRQVGRRGGLAGFGDRLRNRLAHDLAPSLRGERRSLVLGFVLGEEQGLSPALKQEFRVSGLYHLLAVSGQNVAFLVAGVLALSWLVGLSRRSGESLALVAIGAFVLVVGWQPSVVRAAVAGALASLAWLVARPRDRWYFLCLGAIVLLASNPKVLFDPGFQLSFAAVAAIFIGSAQLERKLAGYPLPAVVRGAISISVLCSLATAPILLAQFGTVPVYGVLANVLVEPVVPFVLFLALASALVAPVLAPAASALASLNGLLVAYIGFCAHLVASLPGAQASASQLIAICVAGALAATYPFLRSPRPARFATLVSLAAICLLLWHERPRPLPPPPRGLRVTFLDVGQGDATLLQTPEGALLVDEGPPEAKAVSQLRGLGITSLAAIVLTHPQRDHVGGAADVLRRINVGSVLDPGIASESWFEQAARSEARRRRIPLHIVEAGEFFKLGKLELRVLWPPPASARNEDVNEYGIVLLVSYGAIDLLLPADVESQVTLPLRLPPVEVLKVAHHGSLDAGLPELLDRLRPTLAVISVGRENDYGHPAPETIDELAHYPGLSFYRTDLDGRVTLESDGRRLVLKRGN